MKAWAGSMVAVALCAALSGCAEKAASSDGGGAVAAPVAEDELLAEYAKMVKRMAVVEWQGQAFKKPPAHGAKRPVVEVEGRWFRDTGDSELTMTSYEGRREEKVDYLALGDRLYFNSDDWGFAAKDCWADITGDHSRSWALPSELDPTWAITAARPMRLQGDGMRGAVPQADAIAGLPRGFYPQAPAALGDLEAQVEMSRHGDLLVLGVDIATMWSDVDEQARGAFDKRGAWWAMTVEESGDTSAPQPPQRVFDPSTTPPSQCMKG